MKTWEHRASEGVLADTADLVDRLNMYGAEGWELVTIVPKGAVVIVIFKREVRGDVYRTAGDKEETWLDQTMD